MTHGSLFSGIGGFDLAAEWMGWQNLFHCEWMPFPRKVLDYYWPNAESFTDITKTDFTKYANKIEVLSGGFPCQPFSLAGKRKGTSDERYLWHDMLRAIQEIKPKYVIAENVFGITNIDGGLVFEQVCLDLEAEGYEVQPFIIPASAKNAPHRRDRCWFIAYSKCNGFNDKSTERNNTIREDNKQSRTQWECASERLSDESNAPNSNSDGQQQCNSEHEKQSGEGRKYALNDIKQDALHTNCNRLERRVEKNESKISRGIFAKSSSSMESNNFKNFPSQSPICGGDDGLPAELDGITFSKWRAESIKGYGNAIVPQIAYQLFQICENHNCNPK